MHTLQVPTPDGALDAQLCLPASGGPAPLVVFHMDAFGLRPTLSAMAQHLADAGYAVVQPNLFWRSGPFAPFDPRTTFSDPPERARVMGLMNAVKPSQVAADTEALLEALATEPGVRPGPVGLIGYCMGGRQATLLAAHLGARAAALASIHGGGLVRPDPSSPHLRASQIRARCYFGVADNDSSCSAADCEVLEKALTEAGVDHQIELYPGCLHGFSVPDMAPYDPRAAAQHWDRVLALFGDTLRP